MRKVFLFLLLIFIGNRVFCQVDSTACGKFRTGQFVYLNDSLETVIVKRTDKKQEERNQKTGEVNKFRVRWTGTCEYELVQTWSSKRSRRKANGQVTKIQITKLHEEGYDYRCACENGLNPVQGTIRKMK